MSSKKIDSIILIKNIFVSFFACYLIRNNIPAIDFNSNKSFIDIVFQPIGAPFFNIFKLIIVIKFAFVSVDNKLPVFVFKLKCKVFPFRFKL
ncbi:MAG: hypothetical protein BHV88_17895 [Clostridiales bacterium 41_12_two_minus]|nr:MAG: hypothetical protein BHV88_17895 [Clostridiales bacterium 41_12_two_minus]